MKLNPRILILPLLLAFAALPAYPVNDTIIIRNDESTEIIEHDLDSLLNNWFIRMSVAGIDISAADSVISEFSDSIYKDRISRINSVIILPYNNIIRNHIHVYTERKVDRFRVMLGLQDFYFPMIEDIFDYYGLPVELKYMAVIDRLSTPTQSAVSVPPVCGSSCTVPAGCTGLTINSVVDERRDLSRPPMLRQGTSRICTEYTMTGYWSLQHTTVVRAM
jgi:hypothetical protein